MVTAYKPVLLNAAKIFKAIIGQNILLFCPILCDPFCIFEWTKENEKVQSEADRIYFNTFSNSQFVLHNVTKRDEGVYVCLGDNGHGVLGATVRLSVYGHGEKIGNLADEDNSSTPDPEVYKINQGSGTQLVLLWILLAVVLSVVAMLCVSKLYIVYQKQKCQQQAGTSLSQSQQVELKTVSGCLDNGKTGSCVPRPPERWSSRHPHHSHLSSTGQSRNPTGTSTLRQVCQELQSDLPKPKPENFEMNKIYDIPRRGSFKVELFRQSPDLQTTSASQAAESMHVESDLTPIYAELEWTQRKMVNKVFELTVKKQPLYENSANAVAAVVEESLLPLTMQIPHGKATVDPILSAKKKPLPPEPC